MTLRRWTMPKVFFLVAAGAVLILTGEGSPAFSGQTAAPGAYPALISMAEKIQVREGWLAVPYLYASRRRSTERIYRIPSSASTV